MAMERCGGSTDPGKQTLTWRKGGKHWLHGGKTHTGERPKKKKKKGERQLQGKATTPQVLPVTMATLHITQRNARVL